MTWEKNSDTTQNPKTVSKLNPGSVAIYLHIFNTHWMLVYSWYLDAANQGISNGHSLYRTPSKPSYVPGINSRFIICIGIIRHNNLVSGRARAESNPGHGACHSLPHMAAGCINHSTTRAGQGGGSFWGQISRGMGVVHQRLLVSEN